MSKSIIKLNEKGIIELLQSRSMQNYLVEQGKAIQKRCGSGYESENQATIGRKRAIVRVSAVTNKAKKDNYDNNTLIKALGGR